MEASFKILFTIRSYTPTHESLSIVQPYHFQAVLVCSYGAFLFAVYRIYL